MNFRYFIQRHYNWNIIFIRVRKPLCNKKMECYLDLMREKKPMCIKKEKECLSI